MKIPCDARGGGSFVRAHVLTLLDGAEAFIYL